jgi:CheY-like chemotaxis protein
LLRQTELASLRVEHCNSLADVGGWLGEPALQCVVLEHVANWDVSAFLSRVQNDEVSFGTVLVTDDSAVARRIGAQEWVARSLDDGTTLVRLIESAIQKQSLRRLQRRLYRAERLAAVGELAAAVVHEVNNPAAFALANLSELRDRVEELVRGMDAVKRHGAPTESSQRDFRAYEAAVSDIYEMVDDSLEGVQRIASIVSELRRFSLPASDEPAPLRLNDVVRAALRLLKSPITSRAKLTLDLRTSPAILGKREDLTRAVIALIEDALDQLEALPSVERCLQIRTEGRNDMVRVVVENSVPSLHVGSRPPPRRSLIQPRRLSTASETIAAHGGTLTVERRDAEAGRPATVRRVIELLAHQSRASRDAERLPHVSPERRPRVLIIDDERALLRAYQRALGRYYEVTTAESGSEALGLLAGVVPFDAILCDLTMPGMDGSEFFQRLSELSPELTSRLLFCSGGTFAQNMHRFVESVPNPVLKKPVTADVLHASIEGVLARHEHVQHG